MTTLRSFELASQKQHPPKGLFDNTFVSVEDNNLEVQQIRGKSSFLAWYLANRALPSAKNNQNLRAVPYTNKILSSLSSAQAEFKEWQQASESYQTKGISFWQKLRLIRDSMPPFHGQADWWAFPITVPNYIFGRVANIVGFLIKTLGDVFSGVAGGLMLLSYSELKNTGLRAISGGATIFFAQGMLLLIKVLLVIFVGAPLAITLWVLAQPIHMLSNTINYLRNLFDGITNLVVSAVGFFTRRWGTDKATYANPWYSLYEVLKNTVLLAPIALLIAFSLVPIAGPVSAFLGSIVMNIGLTTALGAINLAIFSGFLMSWQIYAATVTAITTFFQRKLSQVTPFEKVLASQRYEDAIAKHAAAKAKCKYQRENGQFTSSQDRQAAWAETDKEIEEAERELALTCMEAKSYTGWLRSNQDLHRLIQRKAEIEMCVEVVGDKENRLQGMLREIERNIRRHKISIINNDIGAYASIMRSTKSKSPIPGMSDTAMHQLQEEAAKNLGQAMAHYEFCCKFIGGKSIENALHHLEGCKKQVAERFCQCHAAGHRSLNTALEDAIQESSRAQAWLSKLKGNEAFVKTKIKNDEKYGLLLDDANRVVQIAGDEEYRSRAHQLVAAAATAARSVANADVPSTQALSQKAQQVKQVLQTWGMLQGNQRFYSTYCLGQEGQKKLAECDAEITKGAVINNTISQINFDSTGRYREEAEFIAWILTQAEQEAYLARVKENQELIEACLQHQAVNKTYTQVLECAQENLDHTNEMLTRNQTKVLATLESGVVSKISQFAVTSTSNSPADLTTTALVLAGTAAAAAASTASAQLASDASSNAASSTSSTTTNNIGVGTLLSQNFSTLLSHSSSTSSSSLAAPTAGVAIATATSSVQMLP